LVEQLELRRESVRYEDMLGSQFRPVLHFAEVD
jgi:hypothetical protein